MRDGTQLGLASRRRFVVKSKTKKEPPGSQVEPPAPGTAGDPSVSGATLVVYNSAGSGESYLEALPAADWKPLGSVSSPKGYKYVSSDAANGVSRVVVKRNGLAIKAGGAGWGYTLDEAAQGSVAMRLTVGSGPTWCAEALPRPGRDLQDRFIGAPNQPAPAVCPSLP